MGKMTSRISLCVAALLMVFFLGLLVAADANAGKTAFMKHCKMCHGADGKGNPAMARMLKVEFHAMDSEYMQKKTDAEFIEATQKGKGKMVAVRGITEAEIRDVVAYIRTLKSESK